MNIYKPNIDKKKVFYTPSYFLFLFIKLKQNLSSISEINTTVVLRYIHDNKSIDFYVSDDECLQDFVQIKKSNSLRHGIRTQIFF